MTYTSGPWSYDLADLKVFSDMEGCSVVVAVRGTTDAGQKLSDDEMEANARLCAAAPALLEALRRSGEALNYYISRHGHTTYAADTPQMIADAIAAAEGRSR